jgi:hypothetical protein
MFSYDVYNHSRAVILTLSRINSMSHPSHHDNDAVAVDDTEVVFDVNCSLLLYPCEFVADSKDSTVMMM